MNKIILIVSLFIGFVFVLNPVSAELIANASPSYDRMIGQSDLCYRPVYLGGTEVATESVLTVERKRRETLIFNDNVLLRISMSGEPSNEVVISNLPVNDAHLTGAVALTNKFFALIGKGSSGGLLAISDSDGKVIKVKMIGTSYQFKGISRVSSERFLVYGAKSARPFFAYVDQNLDLIKEQQVFTKKNSGIVIRAEVDRSGQSLIMLVQSTNDESFNDVDISIYRANLNGDISASYVVQGFLGDFIETADGIGLVYYDGNKNSQNIKLQFLSNKLKKEWHQDVLNSQLGVIWPRLISANNKQLIVVAAHGLKLYMAAYSQIGTKQWSYWDSGSSIAPAYDYLVAAQSGKILLIQEAIDGFAKYSTAASVCNRVRALGF